VSYKPSDEEIANLKQEEQIHQQVMQAAEEGKLNLALALNPKLQASVKIPQVLLASQTITAAAVPMASTPNDLVKTMIASSSPSAIIGDTDAKPTLHQQVSTTLTSTSPTVTVPMPAKIIQPANETRSKSAGKSVAVKVTQPQKREASPPLSTVVTTTNSQHIPINGKIETSGSADQLQQMENMQHLIEAHNPNSVMSKTTGLKKWTIGSNGNITGFTLTDARIDLMYRLKTNQLYTLEECKILLKEIVTITKQNAEQDLKNLIFLSKFRTEKLFPKPIVTDCFGDKSDPMVFNESIGDHHLVYPSVAMDEENKPKPIQPGEDAMSQAQQRMQLIITETNKSLVKLIDNGLRQRKERMLLACTILSELEELPELADYLKKQKYE